MKRLFHGIALAIVLAAGLAAPPVTIADEIPLEKSSTGSFRIEYAGHHFRINATDPVKVRFQLLTPTQIKLTFVAEPGATGTVSVYWVEYQKFIYNGPIPQSTEPWEGTLNTEGGFVDR